jgi:formate hydrogenlyase transcriptional activator
MNSAQNLVMAEHSSPTHDCLFAEGGGHTIWERLPLGLFVLETGQIVYSNRAFQELLGREWLEEDAMPISLQGLTQSFAPNDRAKFNSWMQTQLIVHAENTYLDVLVNPCRDFQNATASRGASDSQVTRAVRLNAFRFDDRSSALVIVQEKIAGQPVGWAVEERLRFEKLLTDLSSRFVNQTVHGMTELLNDSLRLLVDFLGNDRTTLVDFGDDPQFVSVVNSYSVPGCEPFPLGQLPVSRLPWFLGTMQAGKTVFVRDIATDLPPEAEKEREHCAAHGIRSNVSLPLRVGGKVLGGLTFAFFRQTCDWPSDVVERLQLIADVFANTLMRRRADEELRASFAENERLRKQLEQENSYLREQVSLKHQHGRIIGRGDAISRVLAAAERVAVTDAPVLLLGETGTGKELLSQTIHDLSKRKSRAMIVVNCASLPATLIESELFGREAGAYTGAASAQVGHFQLADGSTLFS